VNLAKWERLQGVHPQTAYCWFGEGTLPVAAVRVNSRSALVALEAAMTLAAGGLGVGLCGRVSSDDQEADLGSQVARLAAWAAQAGRRRDRLGRVSAERVEAALSAAGRGLVVLDSAELDDDLVRDMTGVLDSFCARLRGRRSAQNRAGEVLRCASRDDGPASAGAGG
jgi:putative resolvase